MKDAQKHQKRLDLDSPARQAFFTLGLGVDYATKGQAFLAFDQALQAHNFHFGLVGKLPESGRKVIEILDTKDRVQGHAVLYWHKQPISGYMFDGYIM